MTIIDELLMHPASNAVISDGHVEMYYDSGQEMWSVIEWKPRRSRPTLLWYTKDKASAVAAFAKATGLDSEGEE